MKGPLELMKRRFRSGALGAVCIVFDIGAGKFAEVESCRWSSRCLPSFSRPKFFRDAAISFFLLPGFASAGCH